MKESFETKYNSLFLSIYANLKALDADVLTKDQFISSIRELMEK